MDAPVSYKKGASAETVREGVAAALKSINAVPGSPPWRAAQAALKKRGYEPLERPVTSPVARVVSIRLTPAHRLKFAELGGVDWLRAQLDAAA